MMVYIDSDDGGDPRKLKPLTAAQIKALASGDWDIVITPGGLDIKLNVDEPPNK